MALSDRIPANALATYTDRGAVFGLPHDIHPVMLAYRADIVDPYLARRGPAHGRSGDLGRLLSPIARIAHRR